MVDNELATLIGRVAIRLWGEPNEKLSRQGVELRWGTRGSRKVDLSKGTWYDFENNAGGGVLELIVKEMNCATSALLTRGSSRIVSLTLQPTD